MGCCYSSDLSPDSSHTDDDLGEDFEMKSQNEQSSPFRRWTTGAGAGSSYRQDHRSVYAKQLGDSTNMARSNKPNKPWYGGDVSNWSLGLEQLLADPIGVAAFNHFLKKEFASENLTFWCSCEAYRKNEDPEARKMLADDIWKRHLADVAPEPVNVDAAARKETVMKMSQTPPPTDVFLQAQTQIFSVMKFDSYPRFLRSQVHAECARAELCGQTPPFLAKAMAEALVPFSETAQNDTNPPKQLKKSASNASERRRSGGVSLMPWRRAGSRDRARDAPAPAPPPNSPDHHVTDVVKATQAVPGGTALCRVVLPDGATSVVEVDDATTVGKLVDRLLSRRNLQCNAYEVTLKELQMGESRIIDSSSVSSNYAGREIVVDKRCLVRLEVGGRCVMVRCKPSRRLRHIVRPVIAKYLPEETIDKVAVVQNGVIVDYDTVMEDLDGKKMSVVANSCITEVVRLSDLETESLNEALLRPPDDDMGRLQTMSRSGVSDSWSSVRSAPAAVTMVVPAQVNPVPPGLGSTPSVVSPPSTFANDRFSFVGSISPSALVSSSSSIASGMSTPSHQTSSVTIPLASSVNSDMSMIPPPTVFAAQPPPSMSVAVQTTSPATVAVQTTMSPVRDSIPPMSPLKDPQPSGSGMGQHQLAPSRPQLDRIGVSVGKVRASLKQGPPILQRPLTGVEGHPTGATAADHQPAAHKAAAVARTPPPLPPKPPHRQPTLV